MKEPQTNADEPSLTLGRDKGGASVSVAQSAEVCGYTIIEGENYGNKGRNSEDTWRLHGCVP